MLTHTPSSLVDGFGRNIDYLRLSVTDRCDFRCTYCMAEDMTFLPRKEVLSIEELIRVAKIFVALGVAKIRVTGGEPLVRQGLDQLFKALGDMSGLRERALTTNGSQLRQRAQALRDYGINSVNISLDTLNPSKFRALTRTGDVAKVLAGIDAAIAAGFERIRLNAVILCGQNDDDILPLTNFAVDRGIDIAFIEEMPLGQVNAAGKPLEFLGSSEVLALVENRYSVHPVASEAQAGPARYWHLGNTKTRLGLISPHSNNFCSSCNRLRVTAEGRLLLCLGNEHSVSLREGLRRGDSDEDIADQIRHALGRKPERHVFDQPDEPQILRFMNASGG